MAASSSSSSSSKSGLLYYAECEEYTHEPHFLEACFLCHKPVGNNTDIFMYRRNTPYSAAKSPDKSRWTKEKSWSMRSSVRKSNSNKSSTSKTVRTNTVAVA